MSSLPPNLAYQGEPEARITPGRHGYWVDVTWGISGLSTAPWWRPTRKGAERKARRVITWWKAQEARHKAAWKLT